MKGLWLGVRGQDPRSWPFWIVGSRVVPYRDLVDIESLVYSNETDRLSPIECLSCSYVWNTFTSCCPNLIEDLMSSSHGVFTWLAQKMER